MSSFKIKSRLLGRQELQNCFSWILIVEDLDNILAHMKGSRFLSTPPTHPYHTRVYIYRQFRFTTILTVTMEFYWSSHLTNTLFKQKDYQQIFSSFKTIITWFILFHHKSKIPGGITFVIWKALPISFIFFTHRIDTKQKDAITFFFFLMVCSLVEKIWQEMSFLLLSLWKWIQCIRLKHYDSTSVQSNYH